MNNWVKLTKDNYKECTIQPYGNLYMVGDNSHVFLNDMNEIINDCSYNPDTHTFEDNYGNKITHFMSFVDYEEFLPKN